MDIEITDYKLEHITHEQACSIGVEGNLYDYPVLGEMRLNGKLWRGVTYVTCELMADIQGRYIIIKDMFMRWAVKDYKKNYDPR